MRNCSIRLATLLLVTVPLSAQVPGNQNGKHLANQGTAVTLFSFPNYFASQNVAGDMVWKILPNESFENAAGFETVSGVVIPVFNQNFTGGPLDLPDVSFHGTIDAGAGCLLPDVVSPRIATVALGNLVLPSQGAFLVDVTIQPATIRIPNGDHCVSLLAPVGESSSTFDSARAFVATGTDPNVFGCVDGSANPVGKTGKYDALNGVFFQAPPLAELHLEVAVVEPVVEPVRDRRTSADYGYGAYDFAVGTGGHTLGWHVEAYQHVGRFAIPFFSFAGSANTFSLLGVDASLTVGPFLDFLIVMQQVGRVVSDGGVGAREDGVFDTFDFPIPLDAIGSSGSVVFFFLDLSSASFVAATNTCTTTFVP